jgi:hypothetical protein
MNKLSWLIYIAAMLPNLSIMLFLCGTLVGLAAALFPINKLDADGRRIPDWEVTAHKGNRVMKALVVTGLCWVLSALLPSERTVLMIAASEMGEKVAETPEAQEIFNDMRTILKQQLEGLKKSN